MLSLLLHFLSDRAGPLSPHTSGASRHPAGLGLNPRDCVPFPLSNLRSVVQEGLRSTQTHAEIHPIQVYSEINLHKKYTYLSSPGVWPSVFSFGPPLPYPKRHFCNSMQASELCQKVLASLKADPSFKVSASLTGSTFPSDFPHQERKAFSHVCVRTVFSALMLGWNYFIGS